MIAGLRCLAFFIETTMCFVTPYDRRADRTGTDAVSAGNVVRSACQTTVEFKPDEVVLILASFILIVAWAGYDLSQQPEFHLATKSMIEKFETRIEELSGNDGS